MVLERFDVAAPNKKFNNSPKPVMGDHCFHSIVFPLPSSMESSDDVPWVSVDDIVLEDWDLANWLSVKRSDPKVVTPRVEFIDAPSLSFLPFLEKVGGC